MARQIKKISLVFREENKKAVFWTAKIEHWLNQKFPEVKITPQKPEAVIVLGGDGTILETARKYQKNGALIFGMNLGTVGFLASVRESRKFLTSLKQFLEGKYWIAERMMISSVVRRLKKIVFTAHSLNDVVLQSLIGIVAIEARIEGYPVQYIKGTGVLVATATGSTAYNLSAHGPIVMPDIKCMILSEILDHNIPTPSVVVKHNREIALKIADFRKQGIISITETGSPADVLLIADGEIIFPLEQDDVITVRRSPRLIKFVELEKNYFFKSLQEKFAFK